MVLSQARDRSCNPGQHLLRWKQAQAALDIIEIPDFSQTLRQDKNQNLQYLKDNYKVRLNLNTKSRLKFLIAYPRTNYNTLHF